MRHLNDDDRCQLGAGLLAALDAARGRTDNDEHFTFTRFSTPMREDNGVRIFGGVGEAAIVDADGYELGVPDADKVASERQIAADYERRGALYADLARDARRSALRLTQRLRTRQPGARSRRSRRRGTRPRRRLAGGCRSGSDPGDGGEGEPSLLSELRDCDGCTLVEVLRAGFVVFHGWTHARFDHALNNAVRRGTVALSIDDRDATWVQVAA